MIILLTVTFPIQNLAEAFLNCVLTGWTEANSNNPINYHHHQRMALPHNDNECAERKRLKQLLNTHHSQSRFNSLIKDFIEHLKQMSRDVFALVFSPPIFY